MNRPRINLIKKGRKNLKTLLEEQKNVKQAMLYKKWFNGDMCIIIQIRMAKLTLLMKPHKRQACLNKSLDDYLLQIKNARKFGFNFNEHKEEKIGILRAFNKKNK